MRIPILVLGVAAVATIAARRSTAVVCPADPLWQLQTPVTRAVPDTPFGQGLSFYAQGGTLHAVWNETGPTPVPHAAGTRRWSWSAGGATITNFPNPVPLSSGSEYIFVGADNGLLYKIDASTGTQVGSVDTRRTGCTQDKVVATPTVQLYQFSNAAFQSAILASRGTQDDLVFVITRTGCGDNSNNRVKAYYASDLTERWIFNEPLVQPMGYGSEGCSIDYANNLIYCGTDQTTPAASSVWALGTTTGALQWSANAGRIRTRPMLATISGSRRLYVCSADGSIRKYDPMSGSQIWIVPPGTPISRNPWVEPRDPLPPVILVTDQNGVLNAYNDNGTSASPTWPPSTPGGGLEWVTMPVASAALGKVYIGRSDGLLQQIDLATGALETMSPPLSASVHDPTLDVSVVGGSIDRLLAVASDGTLVRYCVPWAGAPVAVEESGDGKFGGLVSAPNPSPGGARIEYALPFAARVEIVIYDVAGHRVRGLASQALPAGRHGVRWDGLDDSGRAVRNGVYICRLRGDGIDGKSFERSTKVEVLR